MARTTKDGYGSACRQAMKLILRDRLADYLIQSDADLSHPPGLLPRMIEMLKTKPVVIGSRYVEGGGASGLELLAAIPEFRSEFLCPPIDRSACTRHDRRI